MFKGTMHKSIYCYQVVGSGPKAQIIKRTNSSHLPLTRNMFPTYKAAKAHLRESIQSHIEECLKAKRALLAQTHFDLDYKPTTDIADDKKPYSSQANNHNPRSVWNDEY